MQSCVTAPDSCVSANAVSSNMTACIARKNYHDNKKDSLANQYLEHLGLAPTATTTMKTTMITQYAGVAQSSAVTSVPQSVKDAARDQLLGLMPVMIDMQDRAFPQIPSIALLLVFFCSSVVLFIMSSKSFKNKASKIILMMSVILNGYSQTLGFMVAYATRQACLALLLQSRTQQIETSVVSNGAQSTSVNTIHEAVLIIGSILNGLADSELFLIFDNQLLQASQ